jgi:hypothetical protein
MRARSVTDEIRSDLLDALSEVRGLITTEHEVAWAHIETFCAIALRIISKTNPSKVRDAAMAEEIAARVHGREVLE